MRKVWAFVVASTLSVSLQALDLEPWYGRYLELTPTLEYTLQNYRKVETKCGHYERKTYDDFLDLSIGTSFEPYAIDFEVGVANTRHHSFYFNDFALTARYKLLDDVSGDPVTLTAGWTFTAVSHVGLTDLSNFFHGLIENELHLAVGKETTCFDTWTSRWWAVGGIGIATQGSPWLRLDGNYEFHLAEMDTLRFFTNTLWGLGGHRLCLCHPFKGYGSLHHQSVDVGVAARHIFDVGAIFELSYARRLWARNCPEQVNLVRVMFEYPFGL